MSGTGIDIVPNLPKCPVPVIPAVYTGRMPRYVPYRTHPSLYAVQNVPFGLSTEKKVNNKNVVSLNLKEDIQFAFLRLVLVRVLFRASYFGEVAKTNLHFVQIKTGLLLCEIGRGDGARAICSLARVILQQFS